MTSKERIITAMRNEQPDKVPCSPDISNMIPCKRTGKPFWESLYYGNPPLWKAYIDAAKYFGIDAFFFHAGIGENPHQKFSIEKNIIEKTEEKIVVDYKYTTPAGEFNEEWTFPVADSETSTVKAFDTMRDAMPHLKYLLSSDIEGDFAPTDEMKKILGDEFAIGGFCNTPMLPYHWLKGQLEEAAIEYYTDLEIMHEYRELFHDYNVRKVELFLDYGVDFILIESSGSLTMQSPDIIRDMQLPTIKKLTKMCKEAGVPSMFHSCGRSRPIIPMLAEETDLDGIQPLECPPTGDVDLAEVKQTFGDRLALMGNLNTPELMLKGTSEDVFNASKSLIEDCKEGGGFILSTGDQCGRDTPEENIFAMVNAAEEFGKY